MTFHATETFQPVTLGMRSFEAARLEALRLVGPVTRSETVSLGEALGRVLAETVVAPRDLPVFDQAAMDGYAVRFADFTAGPLRVDGVTHAGDAPTRLTPNCARRIMTGAGLPAGADTVVPYEETTIVHDGVAMLGSPKPEGNIRRAGEDIARGGTVLGKGRRLAWPEIAALAALGIGSVRVTAPIRVSILTTGAELRRAGETLPSAGIYDSNGPMLMALLASLGVEPTKATTVGDNFDALVEQLADASRNSDLVVTSAGMSAGDRDLVRAAIAAAGGTITVSSVAIKPGKPVALGTVGGAAFVGLPGNSQAAAFCALAFVRPMIATLAGLSRRAPVMALSAFACRSSEKTELLPVTLETSSGVLTAHRVGRPGSHRLMPLLVADALAIIPAAAASLKTGDRLEVLPFHDPEFQGVSL